MKERERGKVNTPTLQKKQQVIDLYECRKVAQSATADKLIKGLSARTSKAQDKGIKAYQKEVENMKTKRK